MAWDGWAVVYNLGNNNAYLARLLMGFCFESLSTVDVSLDRRSEKGVEVTGVKAKDLESTSAKGSDHISKCVLKRIRILVVDRKKKEEIFSFF